MKKTLVLAATIAMACSMSALAVNIGVVDMKQIFSSSPQVKKIKTDLTNHFSPQKNKLESMGKSLQSDIDQYQKNKTVMKKTELDKLQSKITTEEMSFREEQAKFQQDLFAAQNDALEIFMKDVKTAVEKVAKDKKLDLVMPQNDLLYNDDSLDVTKEVLSKLA